MPKSSYTIGMLESLEELVLEVEHKPVMIEEGKASHDSVRSNLKLFWTPNLWGGYGDSDPK